MPFELVSVPAEPNVPAWLADRLRRPGVPRDLLRERYRAGDLAQRVGDEERLVSFGGMRLAPSRMCIDLDTSAVVLATADGQQTAYVNATLDQFSECVRAIHNMFPFYREPELEDADEAADRVRLAISAIDDTTFEPGEETYWEAFYYDVQMGSFVPEVRVEESGRHCDS